MKKSFLILLTFILIYTLYPSKIVNAEDANQSISLNSPSAILLEYSTQKIMYAKNEHEKMYPASMTKMMSMYLFLECIENKTHSFDDIVTVSSYAASMGGSQIYLKENEKMSFEDLFTAVAVASANDAVVALAEYTYGDINSFIKQMNNKAKDFGMNNTNFVNTTGFHDPNHYTTAYDMALLSSKILKDYKDPLLQYTSIYETYLREDTSNPFWLVTTNKLLNNYDGMDGLKTGFTNESGYNLSATATRNDMRLIAIVMGGESSKSRNSDITSLLNYGFNNYKKETIYKKGEMINEISFINAKEKKTPIVANEEINIIIKKQENIDNVKINIEIFDSYAPKNQNTIIGKLTISNNEIILAEYNLYPKENINSLSFFDIFMRFIKTII